MAPTLVNTFTSGAHYRDNTNIVLTVTNVQAGDLLVCKALTDDVGHNLTIASSPVETWTNRAQVQGVTGYCTGYIWTCSPASTGTITVTLTVVNPNLWSHSSVIEQWRSAQLDATPATNTQSNQSNVAPSSTLTTEANDSVVSWIVGDWSAVAYGSRAYRSSAVDEQTVGTTGQDYSAYFARQAAASAGSQTYGLTAPTGQKPSMLAIEVQSSGGAPPAIPPQLIMQTRRSY